MGSRRRGHSPPSIRSTWHGTMAISLHRSGKLWSSGSSTTTWVATGPPSSALTTGTRRTCVILAVSTRSRAPLTTQWTPQPRSSRKLLHRAVAQRSEPDLRALQAGAHAQHARDPAALVLHPNAKHLLCHDRK